MNPSLTRLPLALALALALAACATLPPGEDPKGVELLAQAKPVLGALAQYRKDHGEYPISLHELVPRYLKVVPFGPGLRLDRATQLIEFSYTTPWPQTATVVCSAPLGDLQWTCREG
jgi:hypothetical protein